MTEITRYGYMLKVPAKSARVSLTATYGEEGSVLKGTLRAYCQGVKIALDVESDEDPTEVQRMVELAWNGCWTVQSLLQSVQVEYDLSVHTTLD